MAAFDPAKDIRVLREPIVYLLGRQTLDSAALDRFLADHNVASWQTDTEIAGEHLTEELRRRNRHRWRHADLIICASTFTKSSLIEAGADASLCEIVPYGISRLVVAR